MSAACSGEGFAPEGANPDISAVESSLVASAELQAASATCDLSVPPSPPPAASTGGHPRSLLSAAEIAAIRERVTAGAEPWATAYRNLIAAANAARNQAPRSVRTEGATGADYFTAHPYCGWGTGPSSPCGQDCCDGVNNPGADRRDYEAAIAISHAVRDLGLAYAFTGDGSYAERAVVLMRHWAVDGATAMTPKFTNVSSEIELAITMPAMFYGADLIWSYPNWKDRDAFVRWAAALAADVRGKGGGVDAQNFGDWRLVLLGMAAVISEDDVLLKYVFDHYRALVPNQISAAGVLTREIDRTKALFYSLYAVNAISQVCEIARHHGVDLYHFAAASGAGSLERAFDWLAPYVLSPSSWPYLQISSLTANDNIASFELAYLAWGKPSYLGALQRFGRPLVDNRTAGPLTLTHARGAFPLQVITPGGAAPSHASVAADKRSGPAPLTVAFNAGQSRIAGAVPEQFHWDFGDGSSSEQSAAAHTFANPGCYAVTLRVSRGSEQRTTTLNVRADAAAPALLQSSAAWNSLRFTPKTGRLAVTFDMTPAADAMNGVTGLSDGDAGDYNQLAVAVRLSPTGRIDARNGDAYRSDETVGYRAGRTYQVRMEIDVPTRLYTIFVTPPGGAEVMLGASYAFRNEQRALNQLDQVSVFAQLGSHRVDQLEVWAR